MRLSNRSRSHYDIFSLLVGIISAAPTGEQVPGSAGLPGTFEWVNRPGNYQPIRYQTRLSEDSQEHYKGTPQRTAYATCPMVHTDRPQGTPWPPVRQYQNVRNPHDDSVRKLLLVTREKNPVEQKRLMKLFGTSLRNRWLALSKAIENHEHGNDPGLTLYVRHTQEQIAKEGIELTDPHLKAALEQGEAAGSVVPVQFDPREVDALRMLEIKWQEERKAIKRVKKDQYMETQQRGATFQT